MFDKRYFGFLIYNMLFFSYTGCSLLAVFLDYLINELNSLAESLILILKTLFHQTECQGFHNIIYFINELLLYVPENLPGAAIGYSAVQSSNDLETFLYLQ